MPLNSLTYCRSRFKLGWCWAGEGWNVTKGYYDSQTSTKDSQNLCNELKIFGAKRVVSAPRDGMQLWLLLYFTRKFIQWKIWRKRARAKRWFVQKALRYVTPDTSYELYQQWTKQGENPSYDILCSHEIQN